MIAFPLAALLMSVFAVVSVWRLGRRIADAERRVRELWERASRL